MVVVLTGGTGGAKLVQGLSHEIDPSELTIICNTGDDLILHGLYISPDTDTIMYTLAGMIDESKGWGIRGDTFAALQQFEKYGEETWFKLGDRDLATHIERTKLMREGLALSRVTDKFRRALGVRATILPMTDDALETRVETAAGGISFQEYFVKQRWQPEVKNVVYAGSDKSTAGPGVIEAIRRATAVVLCPSNPVTSIGPILAVPGVRAALKEADALIIGVSPIIGEAAISGPAHKLMAAMGMEPSAVGVAKAYADLLDGFMIDAEDKERQEGIEAMGIKTVATAIRMNSPADKRRVAREVLALIEE